MRAAAVALLLLPLSGCLTSPDAPEPTPWSIDAPDWQPGQWWDIELHHFRTGNDLALRRVVAGTHDDGWLVGMPVDDFVDYALIMHFPALGDLRGPGAGFDAHDLPVEWLRFPLTNETTWTTSFYWAPDETVTATTTLTGPHTATVTFGGVRPITLDYDARLGAAVHVRVGDYVEWWVREAGHGHQGTVRVPVAQDLVFYHGRTTEDATDDHSLAPGTEAHDVPLGAYDRASFALLLYDARRDEAPVGHAVIDATATAPDGTTFSASKDADDAGDLLVPFGHGPVEGTWRFDATVAGAGSALLEGIAYDVRDVPL